MIADVQKEIERQKQKAAAVNERLERLMKEMDITDPLKTGNDNQIERNLAGQLVFLRRLKKHNPANPKLIRTLTCFAVLTYALGT